MEVKRTSGILTAPIVHPVGYTVLIFDADDTLRRCTVPGQPCPNTEEEWVLMPHVRKTLARYQWHTQHYFGIASNQGGIEAGFLSAQRCSNLLEDLAEVATGRRWSAGSLLFCPHLSSTGCPCRKPKGALLEAVEMYWYSQAKIHGPGQCVYIGDQDSDRQAAEAVGMDFCWSSTFFRLE